MKSCPLKYGLATDSLALFPLSSCR